MHDKEVNKIAESNLLHDIIKYFKRTKILYIHYSDILHGFMNNRKFTAKFKSFQILLESGCSSTIVMGRMVEKLKPEKDDVTQWQAQAGNITTNLNIKVDFILP